MKSDWGEACTASGDDSCCQSLLGQWAALEELKPAKAKTIAVSNFGPAELQCLKGRTAPSVNQLAYSVGHAEAGVNASAAQGIVVQAAHARTRKKPRG